jgi:hypothetical protein
MLGKEFMMRQELIDAAESSGLATMPIEYVLIRFCVVCAILLFDLAIGQVRVSTQSESPG